MLRVSALRKSMGGRVLFEQVSFTVKNAEIVGLIGPNGCGKSTLLRILTSEIEADGGSISLPPSTAVCMLPQHIEADEAMSVEMWLQPGLCRLEALLRDLERRLDDPEALAAYGEALDEYGSRGGFERTARLEAVLRRVDLGVDRSRPVATLSGGEKTRLALARVLSTMRPTSLLLLDEPTNHLDRAGVEQLEDLLRNTPSAVLLVSHDRRLLDAVTSRTLVIDTRSRLLREYSGGYSACLVQRQAEDDRAREAWALQQARVRRLEADMGALRTQARDYEGRSVNDFQRGKAKRLAARASAQETRLRRELDDARRRDRPRNEASTRARFAGRPLHDARLLALERVSVGPLRDVTMTLYGSTRGMLCGVNGGGKTTLIRAALGLLDVDAGRVWRREALRIGYLPQQQETLDPRHTVLQSFVDGGQTSCPGAAEDARTFLHRFLFRGDDVFKTVGALSRGERARLLLARLMAREPEFLVLDEPTNHLDVDGMESLERALEGFQGALLFATHDRTFAARMRAERAWAVGDGRVVEIPPPAP